MTLTILITIYILSFLRMYFFFKNAFSKDGIWKNIEADLSAFLLTFIPAFNTLASVLILITGSLTDKNHNVNYSKFFNVKK